MTSLFFDPERAGVAVPDSLKTEALAANAWLHNGQGAGGNWLGWVSLPSAAVASDAASDGSLGATELSRLKAEAARLRGLAEVVICIGIGGSYLGARAIYEALGDPFEQLRRRAVEGSAQSLKASDGASPILLFAGQNLSEAYLAQLLEAVGDRSIAAIVISKSGTTLEPAIAFRSIRAEIERRYGREEAARRIVVVTDARRGALKTLADREGYTSFVIPDDIGGRYSVLTPVGLLPLAVAGIDIDALLAGAYDMEQATAVGVLFDENPAAQYAAMRNLLYRQGHKIEIWASYEPALAALAEWWKQLFGESEGKQRRGIFPASVSLTTDLHSLGQYMQEGERTIFETVVSVRSAGTCGADSRDAFDGSKAIGGLAEHRITIEAEADDADGLNFLAGKRLSYINRMAELGACMAHADGGVPVLRLEIPRLDARCIGSLVYFFEKACGISGYLLGVNPFDQPGVEAYKKNMYALLGK